MDRSKSLALATRQVLKWTPVFCISGCVVYSMSVLRFVVWVSGAGPLPCPNDPLQDWDTNALTGCLRWLQENPSKPYISLLPQAGFICQSAPVILSNSHSLLLYLSSFSPSSLSLTVKPLFLSLPSVSLPPTLSLLLSSLLLSSTVLRVECWPGCLMVSPVHFPSQQEARGWPGQRWMGRYRTEHPHSHQDMIILSS